MDWSAHFYTASGVILPSWPLWRLFIATSEVFFWLFVATVVDLTDDWIARAARVRERTSGFSGERLDYIVDYLTFVFLPTLLLYQAGQLPEGWGFFVTSAKFLVSTHLTLFDVSSIFLLDSW